MKQHHYARKERQLKLITKKLQHLLFYQREEPSNQIEKLIQKIKKLVQELMYVLSPTKLKRILGTAAICLGISFTNQISAQSFAPPLVNAFGLSSISRTFAFVDLDGDGDMDLLEGGYYGVIDYFENTGTATNPQFASPQMNPFGLSVTNAYAIPAFADLDGDGDIDLLVGEYGAMQYFENTGTTINPQFAAAQVNPFGLSVTNPLVALHFADLDGDGDMDLIAGEYYSSSIQYFENTGSASNPQFAAPQLNPFGLGGSSSNMGSAFADIDGDGDIDLLVGVGGYNGTMQYFENTGSASNPQFALPQVNPFGLFSPFYTSFLAFADLDGDSDIDLLVGESTGITFYFENTEILGLGVSKLTQSDHLKLFPNPVEDVLSIESEEKIEKIEIFNVLGQTAVIVENTVDKVSLNNLSPGIYTVKVTDAKGNYTVRKIQKQ